MKRQGYYSYIFLVFILLISMSLSSGSVNKIRYLAVSSTVPAWSFFFNAKKVSSTRSKEFEKEKLSFHLNQLSLENTMLKNQLNGIYEWLFFENRIEDQVDNFKGLNEKNQSDIQLKEFFQRRAEELKEILKVEYRAIPAKVVFRDPSSWGSSLWINVGQKNNEDLSELVIAENSPVVLGQNLIGVVEYVGYKSSRIRLITDAGLTPAVRATRGKEPDKAILNTIKSLKSYVFSRKDLFETEKDKEFFFNTLFHMSEKLSENKGEKYLAKGQLCGFSQPLWRSKGSLLKGIGFNYDYLDEEGSPRELRTGKVLGETNFKLQAEALLEEGDLLVTTGLDGVFPKGLHVAIVSKIEDLNEGDYYYEIKAKPCVSNLNELEFVLVLPPMGFEQE